jgi:hypothetical protein
MLSSDLSFPSTTNAVPGRWVGVAEKQGDILTYLVLNKATGSVVPWSNVCTALEQDSLNLRAQVQALGGEEEDTPPDTGIQVETVDEDDDNAPGPVIKNSTEVAGKTINPSDLKLPCFSPDELLGQHFLHEIDGEKVYATVMKKILDRDAENHDKIKLLVQLRGGELEEVISYNVLSDLIEEQMEAKLNTPLEQLYTFNKINAHEGPLKPGDRFYKGSSYNLLVQWTSWEEMCEPLAAMIKDDPITVAAYAQEQGLLNTPGWKKLKSYTKRQKKFTRMLNQARLASNHRGIHYKFGVHLPRTWREAIELDTANGNQLWQDAIHLELFQIDEYETFTNKDIGFKPPAEYQRINVHLIFDVKHDLKHKAHLVAGGHLTDPPKDSSHSGVVSLCSLRAIALLAELNGLELWAADVGNAYLEA